MTRTELSLCTAIVAVICLPLVLVRNEQISAASRKDADAIGHVETERDVSILRGGSSHGSNGRRKPGTLDAPTQADVAPGPLNQSNACNTLVSALINEGMTPDEALACYTRTMAFATAHRATNRGVWPGASVGMPTNQIPEEP